MRYAGARNNSTAIIEVQFEPAVQAKLEQMARVSGRATADLVQDAVVGYVGELAETRQMLSPGCTRELTRAVTAPNERLRPSSGGVRRH